jgi:hypothetical protein
MALFTDGPISTLEDLAGQDSTVLDVASTEDIDANKKIDLAQDEISVELSALLPEGEKGLGTVVVTTALRLWHVFQTLGLIYRDAYYTQLNDRYRGKKEEYERKAQWAAQRLMQSGVGIVPNPVPRAAGPELNAVAGSQSAGTYFACISWVDGTGTEGAASTVKAITLEEGTTVSVRAPAAPAASAGWNVYVGLSVEELYRQNAAPLPPGSTWVLEGLSESGIGPGTGQTATYLRAMPRLLERG